MNHRRTHLRNCSFCGLDRGSTLEEIYWHNLVRHLDTRPYICVFCGDSFYHENQFLKHAKPTISIEPTNLRKMRDFRQTLELYQVAKNTTKLKVPTGSSLVSLLQT